MDRWLWRIRVKIDVPWHKREERLAAFSLSTVHHVSTKRTAAMGGAVVNHTVKKIVWQRLTIGTCLCDESYEYSVHNVIILFQHSWCYFLLQINTIFA